MVERGMSVIFISHKLKEVVSISEQVIVLRSGRVVFEGTTKGTSRQELAHAMIGRDLPERQYVGITAGQPVLELRDVDVVENKVPLLQDVTLEVRQREIVGIVGVSGNGQEPLFQLISGLRQPSAGTITMLGKPIAGATPAELIERSIGRIPEDRHTTGLVVDMPIWENMIAETYRTPEFQRAGFLRRKNAVEYSKRIIEQYDVRCSSAYAATRLLSGGNMQKLILGRNLSRAPQVIIANQPTRGLDIGAVSFVHDRLVEAKQNGAGILLISDDLDELLTLSDRLVVASAGRLSKSLLRNEVTIEQLGLMMMGQTVEMA
jgi:simple sugar transport system ATP-binding protein